MLYCLNVNEFYYYIQIYSWLLNNCFLLALVSFIKPSWLSVWRGRVRILCPRGTGTIPVVTSHFVWPVAWLFKLSQIRPSSEWIPGEIWGRYAGRVCESTWWLAYNPHSTFWLKGHETESSTAGLDLKGLVPSYLLFTSFLLSDFYCGTITKYFPHCALWFFLLL